VISHPFLTLTIERLAGPKEKYVERLGFMSTVRRDEQHIHIRLPAETDCRDI
jgi:hypothetical protein